MFNVKGMSRKTIIEIISALLILLFVYAAVSKLMAFDDFLSGLRTSPFIKPYAYFLVWTIPIIELSITVFLFIKATQLLGLYSAVVLLSLFTIYIIWVLNFSPKVPCSCGGVIQSLSWRQHIIFNLAFLTLTIIGIMVQKKMNKQKAFSGEAENL